MEPIGHLDYEPLRNYLRTFDRTQLLLIFISASLDTSHKRPEEWSNGLVPWEVLGIIKFILKDWENIKGKRPLSQPAFINIVNKYKSLIDQVPTIMDMKDEHALSRYFRMLAFQQFWHQKGISALNAGRSIKLFQKIAFPEDLESIAVKEMGLSRQKAFDLLMMAWSAFTKPGIYCIKDSYFSAEISTVDVKDADAFLKFYSLSPSQFSDFIDKYPIHNYVMDHFGPSPFIQKPFININGHYYLLNISIIRNLLEHGNYDFYSNVNKSKFGDFFGPHFETHIRDLLKDNSFKYTTDKELQKLGAPRQVDFAIFEQKSLVMIECKAIEGKEITKRHPTVEVMSNAYKKDAIKAIYQANEFIKWQKQSKDFEECYLLIVTYKDLFLGNTEVAWSEFIQNTLLSEYGTDAISFPSENIFYISAEEFDYLMIAVEQNSSTISAILKAIVIKKMDVKNRKFRFVDYLKEYISKDKVLPHKEFEAYFKELLEKYFLQPAEVTQAIFDKKYSE